MKTSNVIDAYRHFEALAKIATQILIAETPYAPLRGEKLYGKLLRIERKMHNIALWQCNGTNNAGYQLTDKDFERLEKQWDKGCEQVKSLINKKYHKYLHFNGDPRGYTLKLDFPSKGTKNYLMELNGIHTDFGGCGILAPDF